jgi:hypothetical protein
MAAESRERRRQVLAEELDLIGTERADPHVFRCDAEPPTAALRFRRCYARVYPPNTVFVFVVHENIEFILLACRKPPSADAGQFDSGTSQSIELLRSEPMT